MKKLFLGTALAATLVAGPAVAQSYQPSSGSGNIVGDIKKPNAGPEIPRETRQGGIANQGTTGSGVSDDILNSRAEDRAMPKEMAPKARRHNENQ